MRVANGWANDSLLGPREDLERDTPAGENAELVEKARQFFDDGAACSASSANSTGAFVQPAIYPAQSILTDWMNYARLQEESADCYLLGSVLPVIAGLLGRRVWFQWGDRKKYANVFNLLAGKPGDRKSSAINLAEALARKVLPASAFLPQSFSPEALFDEFDNESGGRPDKLWIVDDANATLTDWQKSVNGERVATRFLELYDCKGLSESFRRNKKERDSDQARRCIDETSTSIVFGATFNIACFQGQEVRAGMARRFNYYVAERHGRLIIRPSIPDTDALEAIAERFRRLGELSGCVNFDRAAERGWEDYQRANRQQLDDTDPLQEAKLSRLSSAPMQVLSIAMLFDAVEWAAEEGAWRGCIHEATLLKAIAHHDHCMAAAERLDSIAHKAEVSTEAEILLANVRRDYEALNGVVLLSRSELTKRYCPNSGRKGSWKPDDLYSRFIPQLGRQGDAFLVHKQGKLEIYAFRQDQT